MAIQVIFYFRYRYRLGCSFVKLWPENDGITIVYTSKNFTVGLRRALKRGVCEMLSPDDLITVCWILWILFVDLGEDLSVQYIESFVVANASSHAWYVLSPDIKVCLMKENKGRKQNDRVVIKIIFNTGIPHRLMNTIKSKNNTSLRSQDTVWHIPSSLICCVNVVSNLMNCPLFCTSSIVILTGKFPLTKIKIPLNQKQLENLLGQVLMVLILQLHTFYTIITYR